MQHQCWSKESSLTTPNDRTSTRENPWRPDQGVPELTQTETEAAMSVLNITDFTRKFPDVDRTYSDPYLPLQKIGLISFVPAKGATPNKDGFYGFAKMRGNFDTEIEANQRAEYLIRKVDSYHPIQHAYVGRPFPLTVDPKYAAEATEIDIRKATAESISADVKAKRDEEKQAMKEIKDREAALLEESKKAQAGEVVDDPYETYITLQVKKAQLTWTWLEHQKKMAEIRPLIAKTRLELEELDTHHPTFKASYFEKYQEARKAAGITGESVKDTQDNFIRFMVEDVQVPELEQAYQEMRSNTGQM